MTTIKQNLLLFLITLVCTANRVKSFVSIPQQHARTSLNMNIVECAQNFLKSFSRRAEASHILIKGGGAETEFKLQDLKKEIDNSPIKFADAAAKYSDCPSAQRGGDLGSFGPGAMVKEFDRVVFNEAVGEVHGPIQTQFGYHLIYIRERTD